MFSAKGLINPDSLAKLHTYDTLLHTRTHTYVYTHVHMHRLETTEAFN